MKRNYSLKPFELFAIKTQFPLKLFFISKQFRRFRIADERADLECQSGTMRWFTDKLSSV